MTCVDDIVPTLMSPLLSGLIGSIRQLEGPEIPREPASFKADGDLCVPSQQDVPSSSPNEGKAFKRPASKGKAQEDEPPGQ